jgi:hypothetical protein
MKKDQQPYLPGYRSAIQLIIFVAITPMTMKKSFLLFLIWTMLVACTGQKSDQTAAADSPGVESPKNVLLHQLKTTHSVKEWFVPVNIALEGVTAKQAMWNDSSGNHSVGQLAYHLLFWNKQQLLKSMVSLKTNSRATMTKPSRILMRLNGRRW